MKKFASFALALSLFAMTLVVFRCSRCVGRRSGGRFFGCSRRQDL